MEENTRRKIRDLVLRHAPVEGTHPTCIPGVKCIRAGRLGEHLPEVHSPCICLVVQGGKAIQFGTNVYECREGDYMALPVIMPIVGTVIDTGSENEACLCFQMDVDLSMVEEVFLSGGEAVLEDNRTEPSLFVGKTGKRLGEVILRLAELLDSPNDVACLSPLYTRELCYRLLKSEYGSHIVKLLAQDGYTQKISRVLAHITANYTVSLSVKDLAAMAGMGLTAFHHHFKKMTALTPLQFQKQLRLIEARRLLVSRKAGVADAAYAVGYESASQFNREYHRMFGQPPGRYLQQGNKENFFVKKV